MVKTYVRVLFVLTGASSLTILFVFGDFYRGWKVQHTLKCRGVQGEQTSAKVQDCVAEAPVLDPALTSLGASGNYGELEEKNFTSSQDHVTNSSASDTVFLSRNINIRNKHKEFNFTSLQNRVNKAPVLPIIDSEKEMPDLEKLWERFVIVTAFSQNHVNEARGMIASVQEHMPEKRIIVYDLGIKKESIPMVKKFCGVELRNFEFSKYPPHTTDLHNFAWKVFIIKETLQEFGAIFWGDASVRFKGSLKAVLPYLHSHHGFMTHIHKYDPKSKDASTIKHQYFYTHPKMFAELGVDREEYYNATNAGPHVAANRLLFINNSVMNEKVVEPLTQCALRKTCISPKGAHVGNHRFDASALAILVYKNMRYEWTPENRKTTSAILDKVATTQRITEDKDKVKSC